MKVWMALAGLGGCGTDTTAQTTDSGDAPATSGDTGAAPSAYRWEPIAVDGVPPVWGAIGAGPWLTGGLDATLTVRPEVWSATGGDPVQGAETGALETARFCGCALADEGRGELVVLGGRDDGYNETATTERVDVATGVATAVDAGGADDHPVGCAAFFSPAHDRGWVFGGVGGMTFSSETYRYDPAARTFELLAAEGPSARYDPGVVTLPDGDGLVIGGMGAAGFDAEVWRFDADTETWSAVPSPSTRVPDGRRFPWVALSDDAEVVVYGYGTNSSMGATTMRDLWAFELATGEWTRIDPEGPRPTARAFTAWLPGPTGSLGVLAFGVDEAMASQTDAWVLWGPEAGR
ncbi:MAG: kelch repeat-containing protein [Myxococcota bacterium]